MKFSRVFLCRSLVRFSKVPVSGPQKGLKGPASAESRGTLGDRFCYFGVAASLSPCGFTLCIGPGWSTSCETVFSGLALSAGSLCSLVGLADRYYVPWKPSGGSLFACTHVVFFACPRRTADQTQLRRTKRGRDSEGAVVQFGARFSRQFEARCHEQSQLGTGCLFSDTSQRPDF